MVNSSGSLIFPRKPCRQDCSFSQVRRSDSGGFGAQRAMTHPAKRILCKSPGGRSALLFFVKSRGFLAGERTLIPEHRRRSRGRRPSRLRLLQESLSASPCLDLPIVPDPEESPLFKRPEMGDQTIFQTSSL